MHTVLPVNVSCLWHYAYKVVMKAENKLIAMTYQVTLIVGIDSCVTSCDIYIHAAHVSHTVCYVYV